MRLVPSERVFVRMAGLVVVGEIIILMVEVALGDVSWVM